MADEITKHRHWISEDFAIKWFIPELMILTQNMSAVAHDHAAAIGRLIDAKNQLETQKSIELMKFKAYKKYQPSETFCWFGTNIRNLHSAEAKANINTNALNHHALTRQVGEKNTSGAGSKTEDFAARWKNFTTNYCNVKDNNYSSNTTGLALACTEGSAPVERQNLDLKYTQLIETQSTLDIDLTKEPTSLMAKDIMALGTNLYGSDALTRAIGFMSTEAAQKNYLALRSIAAKRNVAQASYNAIIGLKSKGSDNSTKKFLAELIKGVGGDPQELDDHPSYYAQLEILAKRIYQNPHFYTNLYDTPDNIARKSAALKGIELMLERAISESEARQEMLMSVLLASHLNPQFKAADQKNAGSISNAGE